MRSQRTAPLRAHTFFGSRRDAERAERAEESRKCIVFAASANSASPRELICVALLNRDSPYLMSQRIAPLRAQTFFVSRRDAEKAERAVDNRKCIVSTASANAASLREPKVKCAQWRRIRRDSGFNPLRASSPLRETFHSGRCNA
jgi:hypothetical protein